MGDTSGGALQRTRALSDKEEASPGARPTVLRRMPKRFLRLSRVRFPAALLALLLVAGCASNPTDPAQIAKRRAERPVAYASLTPEQKQLVDQGQVQVGMTEDAVYLAWGSPAQVLRRGDATGEATTWLYTGSTTDQFVTWNYVEARGPNGPYLNRVMMTDYSFRDYVSARLVFRNGRVTEWEMLPAPESRTVISPGGTIY